MHLTSHYFNDYFCLLNSTIMKLILASILFVGATRAIPVAPNSVRVSSRSLGLEDLLGGLLGGDSQGNVTAGDLEDLIGGLLGDTMTEGQTIVDLGIANPDFSTLVAAVTAAGLVETLAGEGPFTLFAPTNDAFGSLPEGTVDTLLLPENIDQLTDILKYHVVSGSVPSSSIESGDVETLNGDSITVDVSDAGIMVNDANVITADIMASNGVIHVIDKVLLPPEDDATGSAFEEPVVATGSSSATSTWSVAWYVITFINTWFFFVPL